MLSAMFLGPSLAYGQAAPSATGGVFPNLFNSTERPLRYRPVDGDFLIENGTETFNRPLYGGNTAFRVDGGDRPEFVLYLPGRGGNLRFGVAGPEGGAKWLHQARRITTRYRPGELLYEIRDPILGNGVLKLEAIALAATEGLIVRIEGHEIPLGLELVWAFGGVNGERGARDGDIGTERVPISQWFQLKPEFARGNRIALGADRFTLSSKAGTIVGVSSSSVKLSAADALQWDALPQLIGSAGTNTNAPVVLGRMTMPTNHTALLSLQRIAAASDGAAELDIYRETRKSRNPPAPLKLQPLALPYTAAELPRRYEEARSYFARLRTRVRIDTPDPYINAAMGALNVAADATWDAPEQAVMHGAIAWRAKLLGWRGPYWLDALGWSDRADHHFRYWAKEQNTDPIPSVLPGPDVEHNLARNEAALHSNGDLSNSHYDMNLVYIDALFRHLAWTGDVKLARDLWPMIERHLAWERRLFRRTFGPELLPLYEAYAAIWASDDLYYNGGGTAHASAYNYYHNAMAARIARLIGEDPTPYMAEAEAIARGMRAHLWMPDKGTFGETKDLLGKQRVHPSAGLWTYYHVLDSAVTTPEEAWRMSSALLGRPRIPVHGPDVPADAPYGLYPTTDWLPYSWSINNVVMQENLHTALGLWQARRPDDAFRLTKSALLASMFMGISPGNLGTLTYLDVYRRESQRDFADASGVMSRTIVEGLFGIAPDALAGRMTIRPGLPSDWDHASIDHPVIGLKFFRRGTTDTWRVEPKDRRFRTVTLRLTAPSDRVGRLDVDGAPHKWTAVSGSVGRPEIEVVLRGTRASTLSVRWAGQAVPAVRSVADPQFTHVTRGDFKWLQPQPAAPPACRVECARTAPAVSQAVRGPLEQIDLARWFNDRVTSIFGKGKYLSPRSPYVSLSLPSQGLGAWAGHVNANATIDDSGLRRLAAANSGKLMTPLGVAFATPVGEAKNIIFTSLWANYPEQVTIPVSGRAVKAHLLMAGTTNPMQSRFTNGEVVVAYADGQVSRLPLINPDNWWPIEQDYFIDDYQFRVDAPLPQRLNLKSGEIRILDPATFKGKGRAVDGGAATILQFPLDPKRQLRSVTIRTTANDVVIGLMALSLERP